MTKIRGAKALGVATLLLPGMAIAAEPLQPPPSDARLPVSGSAPSPAESPLIRAAEDAVSRDPRHATARVALGQAYITAGRFQSAETAFEDALLLDPAVVGADLRLVMVRIALGKKPEALARLAAMRTAGREADVGLALALAGDEARARELLWAAARDERATPRLRQNLAFVEALSGHWASAAAIAAQDVPPEQMADRLTRRPTIAQLRDAPAVQMAALIGVVPQLDTGMPSHLVLAGGKAGTSLLASADVVPQGAPRSEAAQSLQQEPVRPAAYSGPPRMRGVRSGDEDMERQSQIAAPVSTTGRSFYRAGSRRGMTVSTRANRFPVRLVAVCASDRMPVLGRGRLLKISLYASPRRSPRAGRERSA